MHHQATVGHWRGLIVAQKDQNFLPIEEQDHLRCLGPGFADLEVQVAQWVSVNYVTQISSTVTIPDYEGPVQKG